MRARHLLRLAVLLLVGCTAPPPSAYVGGRASTGAGLALGRDASGETCNALPGTSPATRDIFCGGWNEPAARVRRAKLASTNLAAAVQGSAWRIGIAQRFRCGPSQPTTLTGGTPALLLRCVRRVGGWPQVALAAAANGRLYLADGIAPTLPVIERAIAVLSGVSPAAAASLPPSRADALMVRVLSAHAFGARSAAAYQRLMALGARANLAQDFATSARAYRGALVLLQRGLGNDNPATADPALHLALQLSDQGSYPAAATLFAEAAPLAPRAADRTVLPRLLHYRGLDALNQGHDAAALALLTRAGAAYGALIPAGTGQGGAPLADPTVQTALIGLVETWRYRAIVLRDQGKLPAASAAVAEAAAIAHRNGLEVPLVTARLHRTEAVTAEARGSVGAAETTLGSAARGFNTLLPQTRPVAETLLLQGAAALRLGDPERADQLCHRGALLLTRLEAGAPASLIAPCLAADATLAARDPARAAALRARMFETAELAQDSVTSREIAEAAARLATHARNPAVAAAIRRRQLLGRKLAALFRQRDALHNGAATGVAPATALGDSTKAVDAAIAKTETDLADADAALQAAAPNYRQLVQQVVPAKAVLAALHKREAFVAIMLTQTGGWSFLLRDGQIHAARLTAGRAQIGRWVRTVRASIEPNDAGKLPPFAIAADQAIYRAVLAPVAAGLRGASDLVVAPSGPLLAIPFGILLTGPAHNNALGAAPWLVKRFPISHVPAAANFVALSKLAGGSHAPRPWFGFGAPIPVTLAQAQRRFPLAACADSAQLFAGLPQLPFALRELTAARELLGAAPRDQLTGTAYTTAAVAKVDLRRYRVLHFATHALLPAELRCQSQPAIVASVPRGSASAGAALLTAGDVLGLDLDANTVILSACNSGGIGRHAAGESLSALARAFFFAGARSMLVTHWSISDQASAYLVAETLRRYAAGGSGGLAGDLRAAQLEMIDGAGHALPAALAHPFFWGAFALVGAGRVGAGPQA